MQISDYGIKFIKQEEGEKLTAYLDSVGIPTIGVGHTGTVDGKPVAKGMVIAADKSSELLRQDLRWTAQVIDKNISAPLTQNQYDALCSLIFNIGAAAFANSTVKKELNKENYQAAADAFLLWKKAGNAPNILLPRRKRERALFLTPDK